MYSLAISMATSVPSDPGFFQYFTADELATVRVMQIKVHLSCSSASNRSQAVLIAKCVSAIGETRVLAAVRSQLPVPSYTWTSATVVGKV